MTDTEEKLNIALKKQKAEISREKDIREALEKRDIEFLRFAFKFEKPSPYCLYFVCEKGDLEIAELLIEKGANVDAIWSGTGEIPLNVATRNKKQKIVELLLKNGANSGPEIYTTPLELAIRSNQLEIAKNLILYGAKQEISEMLKFAKSQESYKLLLENGADPNFRNVVLFAAQRRDFELVKLLVENGADPHKGGDKGETAFVRTMLIEPELAYTFNPLSCTQDETNWLWEVIECSEIEETPHVFEFLVKNDFRPSKSVRAELWEDVFFQTYKPNMLFLLLARESPNSPFYKENFPLDLLKTMAGLMKEIMKREVWVKILRGNRD